MRRITETLPSGVNANEKERGVIAPLAAILMVALLGFGALAVDVGAMYSEKAQLQNGADSAALAIAQTCAKSPCPPDPTAMAALLANGNALDGSSSVVSATIVAGTVDVTTATPEGAGGEHFSLYLARVLGINSVEIQASAQAKFGGIAAADVVPLTFSKCESDPGFTKGLQFFPMHGSGLEDEPGYECKTGPSSGWELPGGFGWLEHSAADVCTLKVDVDNPWIKAVEGGAFDSSCDAAFVRWKNKLEADETVEILVPIFDISCPVKEPKKPAPDPCVPSPYDKSFHIEAFAQISIRGWHFIGGGGTYFTEEAAALETSLKLKNSDTGLYGTFIKKVSLAEAAELGGPTTYGSLGVTLSK